MRDWKNWTFWGTGTEVEVAVRERERRVRRGVFRRCMVCFFFRVLVFLGRVFWVLLDERKKGDRG